ncbi:MAG TPA: Stp1/IreP family PP2C-type Ser/Thr phosphatase [Gaiellaceae bacterium]|nr:Stp1/IreP family PP2C-type Ser/Thr phosphatase [Gaiellaceae bacterium]
MLAGFTGVTDPGRRRRRNEDAYVAVPPLFAIADGMGGAQAGEVASGLAAAVLEEATGDERGEERVASLIQEANRRVFQRSSEDATTSGMGTTMTVALLDNADGTIAFGHVGDSRAYRVRGGELEQLTDDHSLVGELVRSGRLSPEEAESHPQRSVITRALGTEPNVDVDTFTVGAEQGDIYLLCSDGLTDMIPPRDILAAVEASDGLDEAARALVGAANAGGGEDNITVVLFQIDGQDGAADLGETARLPAAVEPEHDDEDTLSPLDAVPAVDTAVIPAAVVEEHLQQVEADTPKRSEPRRRILPLVLLILLLIALVALALWGLTR